MFHLYSSYFKGDLQFHWIVIGWFGPVFTLKNLQFWAQKSTGTIRCLNHKLLKINQ